MAGVNGDDLVGVSVGVGGFAVVGRCLGSGCLQPSGEGAGKKFSHFV